MRHKPLKLPRIQIGGLPNRLIKLWIDRIQMGLNFIDPLDSVKKNVCVGQNMNKSGHRNLRMSYSTERRK